jgi:hypothetical protein
LFPDLLIQYPYFGFHEILRPFLPIIGIEINVPLCTQIIVHDHLTHNYFTNISGAYGEDQKNTHKHIKYYFIDFS